MNQGSERGPLEHAVGRFQVLENGDRWVVIHWRQGKAGILLCECHDEDAARQIAGAFSEKNRLEEEIRAAYGLMLSYAASNPRREWRGKTQDPNGVHAWLERNAPNAAASGPTWSA